MAAKRGGDREARRLIAAALAEAERHGWQGFQMRHAARRAGLSAARARAHFAHKEDLADAWLAEADRAMLAAADALEDAAPAERLTGTLLAWLDHLSPHRRVAAGIFAGRLYPFHPHDVVRQVLWTSRTVQWWREAAGRTARFPQRQAEEIALTWIFAATLLRWSLDASPNQARTRKFLGAALSAAGRAAKSAERLARAASPRIATPRTARRRSARS